MDVRLVALSRIACVFLAMLPATASREAAAQGPPRRPVQRAPVGTLVIGPAITRLEVPAAVIAGQPLPVKVTIESAQGVDQVVLSFGGRNIGRPGGGRRSVALSETFPAAPAGSHKLVVRARDGAGRTNEATELIEVKPLTAFPTLARRGELDRLASAALSRTVGRSPSGTAVQGIDLDLNTCTIRCKDSVELGYYPADGCANGYTSNLQFRIGATLRNRGTQGAAFEQNWVVYNTPERPGSWQPGYPKILAPASGLYVAPGAAFSVNDAYAPTAAASGLEPGEHRFVFMVDPDNRIPEANENNNTLTCTLTVTAATSPPPSPEDLAVTAVTVTPTSGPPSTPFRVKTVVRNAGGTAASGNIAVRCEPGGSKTVSNLAAGASVQVEMSPTNYPMPPGSKTAACTVDPYSQRPDTNRTNNTMTTKFEVTQ